MSEPERGEQVTEPTDLKVAMMYWHERAIDAAIKQEGTDERIRELEQTRDHLRAERDQLREFVAAIFEASDWPSGGDVDLWTFQDLCEAHGILLPETRSAPCGEHCSCEEYHGAEGMAGGVTCYRKPQWLIDAARKQEGA